MPSVEILEKEPLTEFVQEFAVKTEEIPEITETETEQEVVPELDFVYHKKTVFHIIKRAFDIVASLFAILLLSPFLIIFTLIILVIDFGNPFFTQDRVGKNGKLFKIYKFRSMYKDAEERKNELRELNQCEGALFKIDNDPRILGRFGNFIRKSSIDELPQLLNILKGDMSVIGPRPFVPDEQAKLSKERLLVKPGLSCYWQINGKNKLSEKMSEYYDKKYIVDRSVGVDLKIIFKTFGVILKSDNQ